MTMFDTFYDFAAEIFQTDRDELTPETTLEELGAEEEDIIELLMIAEEEYDISVTLDEVKDFEKLGEFTEYFETVYLSD